MTVKSWVGAAMAAAMALPGAARAGEPKAGTPLGPGLPAPASCVLRGRYPVAKGTTVHDAASAGHALATFTGAYAGVTLSEIPADPITGRARIATTSGAPELRVDGWVAPASMEFFTTRDVPVVPAHVWITGAQRVRLVGAAGDALTAEITVPGTAGQTVRGQAPCDAFALEPGTPTPMAVPGDGRAWLTRSASLDLYGEPGGAVVFSLKGVEGTAQLFWSNEARGAFVHVKTRGALAIDAWARKRDVEALKKGEMMDQFVPPTTTVAAVDAEARGRAAPREGDARHRRARAPRRQGEAHRRHRGRRRGVRAGDAARVHERAAEEPRAHPRGRRRLLGAERRGGEVGRLGTGKLHMRPLLALLACAALTVSCKGRGQVTKEDVHAHAPKPFPGKATRKLVARPEVATLVDALAAERSVESSAVGAAGAPSGVYAKFAALAAKATPDELAALSQHESPVVRGYVGRHLATRGPVRPAILAVLGGDETEVDTLDGCIGGKRTVGAIVREALCYSERPEAGAALLAMYDKGGAQAAEALACAAPTNPGPAGDAALRALRGGTLDAGAEAAYLRAIAVAAPPGGCDVALAAARSGDASVQIAAAQVLGRCDGDAAVEALAGLASGKNVVVARHARASLFLLEPSRRAELAGDRDVMREVANRLGLALRSREGAKRVIAILEPLVLAYPDAMGGPFYRAVETPETTAAARRLAAQLPPATTAAYWGARQGVIAYLARIRDAASLPELRRSLRSSNPGEVAAAVEALGAMHDREARPAIEKLASSPDARVAQAAKKALAAP